MRGAPLVSLWSPQKTPIPVDGCLGRREREEEGLLFPTEIALVFPVLAGKRGSLLGTVASLLGTVAPIPTHLRTTTCLWELYPRPTLRFVGIEQNMDRTPKTRLFSPVPISQLV